MGFIKPEEVDEVNKEEINTYADPGDTYRIRTSKRLSFDEYCEQRENERAENRPIIWLMIIFGVVGIIIGFVVNSEVGFRGRSAAQNDFLFVGLFALLGAILGMTVYGLFEIIRKWLINRH